MRNNAQKRMFSSLLLLTGAYGVCGFLTSPKPQIQFQRTRPTAFVGSDAGSITGGGRVTAHPSDGFLTKFFTAQTDCDDVLIPPSLSIILRSISNLASGSDIRGQFIDHARLGSIANVAHDIGRKSSSIAPLTPLAAHCLGFAYATMVAAMEQQQQQQNGNSDKKITIAIGRDPRPHGSRLADAFGRGAQGVPNVEVVYTKVATTPAMFDFCRSSLCHGGVMVTASHLPIDRNGFKFFTKHGGFTKAQIQQMTTIAKDHAQTWYDVGLIPPTSGKDGVFCSEWVDWMPHYESKIRQAIINQAKPTISSDKLQQQQQQSVTSPPEETLKGLKIVLNAGNGSGGFFQHVLRDLGADVDASMHVEPDSDFPAGIPNPEYKPMLEETIAACERTNADLGIMLDTDADRCGFIVPRVVNDDGTCSDYEPLNRNRLIALLGVVFSAQVPGCAIVTDSVTSEGLATFLNDLGLQHVRYLKGYANVINKAKELTESNICDAQVAIETSGHCALQENGYLDDGTYTAVKVISLLARERANGSSSLSLLDMITDLQELDEVSELRMSMIDGTVHEMKELFDYMALQIELQCINSDSSNDMEGNTKNTAWALDRDNLEGIRVRTSATGSSENDGGFFMLRKSLHDPIISLQIEATSKESAKSLVVEPLQQLFGTDSKVYKELDLGVLERYLKE